jgi:hypothetical protein
MANNVRLQNTGHLHCRDLRAELSSEVLQHDAVGGGKERQNMPININNGVNMAVCQNLVPLVNIKIAGKWMFIPLKMVLIGIEL